MESHRKRVNEHIHPFIAKMDEFLCKDIECGLLKQVQERIKESLGILRQALVRFSSESIALSFNGGKDCQVVLFLYLYIQADHPIPTIYVPPDHSFPQVDEFVDECVSKYHLGLVKKRVLIKQAFAEYLEQHKPIQAVLVGTRRNDPHAKDLQHFQHTDHGWPPFMRIHPIINWQYSEIWQFLRFFQIPYCPLYDQGYTSLNSTTDTIPNPSLQLQDGSYLAAYLLKDQAEERLGRM